VLVLGQHCRGHSDDVNVNAHPISFVLTVTVDIYNIRKSFHFHLHQYFPQVCLALSVGSGYALNELPSSVPEHHFFLDGFVELVLSSTAVLTHILHTNIMSELHDIT
jgi:hypothetical protein